MRRQRVGVKSVIGGEYCWTKSLVFILCMIGSRWRSLSSHGLMWFFFSWFLLRYSKYKLHPFKVCCSVSFDNWSVKPPLLPQIRYRTFPSLKSFLDDFVVHLCPPSLALENWPLSFHVDFNVLTWVSVLKTECRSGWGKEDQSFWYLRREKARTVTVEMLRIVRFWISFESIIDQNYGWIICRVW